MSAPAPSPGTVLLIRHGQTDYSSAGRCTGLVDVPLNAEGEQQARALVPVLAAQEIAQVWSSPLGRAQQTARLAGLADLHLDPQLLEWDYGAYDGLTKAQVAERLGRPWSLWHDGVEPGETPGETLQQVRARGDDVLRRVLPVLHDGGNVALVAHGHQLRVLATAWLDVPPEHAALLALGPASVSVLGYEDDQQVLRTWNARPHELGH